MIKFYIGKSKTGKSFKMMNEIVNDENKNLIYLVPEQFNLEAEKQLINKMKLDGLINIDVLSFSRLVNNVLKSVGNIKKIEIDDFGKIMVLRKVLEKNKNDLEFYKKSVNKKGLIDKFNSLFKMIKINGLNENDFKNIFEGEALDISIKKKSNDIVKIYSEFNEFLSNGYFDEEDKMNFVIEKIDETGILDNASIWIDEFHGFNELQMKLIEKMMLNAKDLIISLTLDPDFNDNYTFKNVRDTYKNLQELLNENNLKYEIVSFKDKFNLNEEIAFLSDNIFKYPNEVYEKKNNKITGFIGTNRNEEIELIAIKIKELIMENKYSWRDIAVIATDLDSYKISVKSIFKEYEIPYFIDEKISIMNNKIIEFIIATLKIYQNHFRYEDIFSMVKTGFTNIDKDESEILENYVIENGINGNLWKSNFKRGKRKYSEEELEYINKIREKLISPFLDFFDDVEKKEINVSDFTIKYYNFLKTYGLIDSLEKWIIELKNISELEKVNENTQIWNIIMKIIEQFVELFNDKKITLKEYIKILSEGILEYEVGILPSLQDEIIIGNISRTKLSEVKIIFIVGVNDGLLPMKIENNDIFSQEEKEIIKDKGLDLKNDIEYKISEENYLIYRIFSKPSEELFISYALADNDGKSLRKSIIIDKIKKIFPEIIFQSNLYFSNHMEEKFIVTKKSTLKYLIYNLRNMLDGYEINELWFKVYKWYYENQKEDLEWILSALFHDNSVESIGEEFAKELFNLPLKASVTKIDTYVKCPFKHFIKYGLRLNEINSFEVELPDLGLMFHKSLEEFAYELDKNKITWNELTKEKSDEIITDIIEKITNDYSDQLFNDNYRNKYYKKKILRVAKKSIWTLRDHVIKGEFIPKGFEIVFSDDKEGLKPIIVDLKNDEKMIIEGKIDRLDVLNENDETYVKIIDYKSGNSDLKLSDIYNGNKIQLMIYLNAFVNDSKYFGYDKIVPAGVYYFKIDDPIIDYKKNLNIEEKLNDKLRMTGISLLDNDIIKKIDNTIESGKKSSVIDVKLKNNGDFDANSKVIEKNDFDLLLNHVSKFIANVGNEIIEGKSSVYPLKTDEQSNACNYCKYLGICQFDRQLSGNKYRTVKKYKDKEVIELLNKNKIE